MQRFIDELAKYIESSGIASLNDNLFIGRYSSSAPPESACMVIRLSGGMEPSKEVPLARPMVQVLSRAPYFPEACDLIMQVYELLHGYVDEHGKWVSPHNYWISDYYVYESRAVQVPGDISPDEKGRSELSVNFAFRIKIPARK